MFSTKSAVRSLHEQPAEPARPSVASWVFGEADLEGERFGSQPPGCVYPPDDAPSWQPGESDIHALTVPPGEFPNQNLPDSIQAAILASLDQVPRAPSSPELPPAAYFKRTS